MSKDLKVILIIFGSLFVLVLAAAGVGVVAISHFARGAIVNSHDPSAMARTAAKIARFTLPPGYRIRSAMDFGLSQSATIAPIGRGRLFRIQLSTTTLKTESSGPALDAGTAVTGFFSKLAGCDLKPQPEEQFVVRGETIPFRVMGCDLASQKSRIEMGIVKGSTWNVQVIATGFAGDFDDGALRRLLSSFK
jgi:hypothetical protein